MDTRLDVGSIPTVSTILSNKVQMIKAAIKDENGKISTLLLGIDAENIKRLQNDKPISVDGTPFGVECNIVIMYGDTYQDIIADLKKAGFNLPETPTIVKSDKSVSKLTN